MPSRVSVTEKELKEVQKELKQEGYSIRDINSEIGCEFKNYLYKGHNMDEKFFLKLQDLLGRNIDHQIVNYTKGKSCADDFSNLTKSAKFSELVGIILGDGHIREKSEDRGDRYITQYYLQFTFHEDETELVQRTKDLCFDVFGNTLKEYTHNTRKAVQLKLHSKELVEELKDFGLQTGNKVQNQVSVPKWIFENQGCQEKCISGLVDTDGCIYVQENDDRGIIKFSNRSDNLLEDFKRISQNLNFSPSNAGEHEIQLAHQEDVKKFCKQINPIKSKGIVKEMSPH
jgi:hypothetical protein